MKNFFIGKSQVEIGNYSYGIENIRINEWGEGASLFVGKFCSIALGVTVFLGGNHRIDWITTYPFGLINQSILGGLDDNLCSITKGDVKIGNDVWVGDGVTIMSGLTIGDGAVLAANSNITRNVGPYEVFGGNPAKLIKKRFNIEIIELLLILRWWDLPTEVIREISQSLCSPPAKDYLLELIKHYRS